LSISQRTANHPSNEFKLSRARNLKVIGFTKGGANQNTRVGFSAWLGLGVLWQSRLIKDEVASASTE